ncbi:hypothetical protein SK128_020208 [Halocaridina rubra]|uniref:MAP3K HisK-N-like globin domain-containing protein n=1 Tax=Halocaridina rubra TaxID=373956 RepID=A0AAN8ZP10_HALRR
MLVYSDLIFLLNRAVFPPVVEETVNPQKFDFNGLEFGYGYGSRCNTAGSPSVSPASPSSYLSSLSYTSSVMTGSDLDDSLMTRRSSSGGLLSPEVESPRTDGEQDGFYLLKKDSQRRMTLTKVLMHDQHKITQIWHQRLQRELGTSALLITQPEQALLPDILEGLGCSHIAPLPNGFYYFGKRMMLGACA